jgi:hypothetical protein
MPATIGFDRRVSSLDLADAAGMSRRRLGSIDALSRRSLVTNRIAKDPAGAPAHSKYGS